jgi:glyoxylase-like metal-dependent hydrolase (beta-lactamase superfamily II)
LAPVRTPTLPPATHTNVVLLGQGRLLAVDVASPYPEEQQRLDATLDQLAPERIDRVLLTHHHLDHVSGAAHLRARLGVPIAAHPLTAERLAGRLGVDELVKEGTELAYGGGFRVLHTPGHAPGHVCLYDSGNGAVIAGDMVASVGTIIVEPDDGGDMALYLSSLLRLLALRPTCLVPAHGPPILGAQARERLAFYLAHRQEREERVLGALGPAPHPVAELVPLAYPDVAPAVYRLAAKSLLAHLIKLEREGRARRTGDGWSLP